MPINPLIPLSANQVNLPQIAQSAANVQGTRRQNQLLDMTLQEREAQFPTVQTKASNEQSMEAVRQSVIQAERLRALVESGDAQGAMRFVQSQEGPGAQQAAQALQKAMQGDPTELMQGLESARQVGTRLGILSQPAGEQQFTLSPGQTRFDAQGNPIVNVPDQNDQGGVLISLVGPEGQRRSLRRDDPEVDRLVGQGWTVAPARTQEVPFDVEEDGRVIPGPEPGRTLFDLAERATGPMSAARSVLATAGAIAGMEPSERAKAIINARQSMELASNDLIRSLSINPRFPVAEIQRIQREVQLQPAFFDDPEIMRERMRAMDEALRRRAAQAEADAQDRSLPTDLREEQRANSSAIRNFLATLGVPEEGEERQGTDLTPEEQAELQQLRQQQGAQ